MWLDPFSAQICTYIATLKTRDFSKTNHQFSWHISHKKIQKTKNKTWKHRKKLIQKLFNAPKMQGSCIRLLFQCVAIAQQAKTLQCLHFPRSFKSCQRRQKQSADTNSNAHSSSSSCLQSEITAALHKTKKHKNNKKTK